MCLAVPGRVEAITGDEALFRTATVDFGGVRREVSLAFLPEAAVGDHVLVHAGIAIQHLDEGAAEAMAAELRRLGEAMP